MGKTSTKAESKADRKLEKKIQFYSKVKDTVASLSAQKSISKKKSKQQRRQKKLKAYDLSSLADFLPDPKLKEPKKPGFGDNFKVNCKSRKKLLLEEAKHFSAVLDNPLFQSDPTSAIHEHLQKTLPVVEEQPKKKVNINGSKKRKKKSKGSTGLQSMDM